MPNLELNLCCSCVSSLESLPQRSLNPGQDCQLERRSRPSCSGGFQRLKGHLSSSLPVSGSCSENLRHFTYGGTRAERQQPLGTDLDVMNSGHCGDRQLPGPGCGRMPTGWAVQSAWRLHLGYRAALSCFSSLPFAFRSPSVTSDHIFSVLIGNKTISGCGLSL